MKIGFTKRFKNRFIPVEGSGGPRSSGGHRLNWRPDLPDWRDHLFRLRTTLHVSTPPKVDLRSRMPEVVDQGAIGSCTGNALAAALEFLQMDELGIPGRQNHEFTQSSFHHVSRLFIYYHERLIEGTVNEDAGATLRSGIKSLVEHGACRESLWEYGQGNLFRKPSDKAYQEAQAFKVSSYLSLRTINDMKQCLAGGHPFAYGFMVFDNFEPSVASTGGTMAMPEATSRAQGGHAVLAVGYDDERQVFVVRNSWGKSWGHEGYFYMPYDYISDPDLADDFWRVSA